MRQRGFLENFACSEADLYRHRSWVQSGMKLFGNCAGLPQDASNAKP
jgi:hypothetical protein